MAFFLRHCSHKGEGHFAVRIKSKDPFRFKTNPYRRLKFFQLPDVANTVHNISGESGNAFGDDHIDLSLITIFNHTEERFTVIQGGAANSFIGIDLHQFPVGMAVDEIRMLRCSQEP